MLGPHEVVPYLQTRGHLSSDAALDGLTLEDASRRNTNLKVLRPRGTSFFLKQAHDADGAVHLAHEASIYQILRADVRHDSVGRCLPRFLGYDPKAHILVLEFLRKSHNLREHYAHKRRFPVALSVALAHAVASVHRVPVKDDLFLNSSPNPPWIFSLNRPDLHYWRGLSSTSLKVIEIIQGSSEFCPLLDNVQQDWRSDTFIHFDLRWDNCIVPESSAPKYARGIRIIDWEHAGLGDACWDLGSVLADYLSLWRSYALVVDGQAPPDDMQRRLQRMQPAMRAFWRTYVRCMQHAPSVANELLVRTARFAAVRVLQTAVERAQDVPEITSSIVGNLQLSLNMLQRPTETIAHLFGIRPSVPGQ